MYWKKPFEFLNLGMLAYLGDDRALTEVCWWWCGRRGGRPCGHASRALSVTVPPLQLRCTPPAPCRLVLPADSDAVLQDQAVRPVCLPGVEVSRAKGRRARASAALALLGTTTPPPNLAPQSRTTPPRRSVYITKQVSFRNRVLILFDVSALGP